MIPRTFSIFCDFNVVLCLECALFREGDDSDILESTGIRRSLEMLGFPCSSAGKESARNEGDLGSIPRLGKSPGDEKGYGLQYSGLENSMDYIVPGVTNSWTQLSNFHFHISLGFPGNRVEKPNCQCRRCKRCGFSLGQEDPLKKETATHSSILAWKIS